MGKTVGAVRDPLSALPASSFVNTPPPTTQTGQNGRRERDSPRPDSLPRAAAGFLALSRCCIASRRVADSGLSRGNP
jgi:hypothetical protein